MSFTAGDFNLDDGPYYKVYRVRVHATVDSGSAPVAIVPYFGTAGAAVGAPQLLTPGGREVVINLPIFPSNDFVQYNTAQTVINVGLQTGNVSTNATALVVVEVWAYQSADPTI